MQIPVGFLLRLLQHTLTAFALSLVTFVQVRTGEPWGPDWLVYGAIVLVALAGPLDAIYRELSEQAAIARSAPKAEDAVKALYIGLVRITNIPWTELGFTVFVLRRSHRRVFARVQTRVYRLRIESYPTPSTIIWTKRKGLLGRVWRTRAECDLDHRAVYGPIKDLPKKEWKKLPSAQRDGLSYKDFLQICDYGYVVGYPMVTTDRGRYVGCLVLQVEPKYADQLVQDQPKRLCRRTAATIAAAVGK